MPLLISTSFIQKQRWLHNWNQGHWRPSFIMSWKNIFQFLSGDLQGRLPKICLATFPWLFVFKVLSVKYFMAYHFIGPDGPIYNHIFLFGNGLNHRSWILKLVCIRFDPRHIVPVRILQIENWKISFCTWICKTLKITTWCCLLIDNKLMMCMAQFKHESMWFGSYLNPHATSGDDTSAKLSLRPPFTSTLQWHLLILAFLELKGLFVLLTLCSSAFCH